VGRVEGKEGLAFVEKLAEKVNTETTQEAYVLAVMESAHYKLLLADMEGTKVAIDKSSKILEGLDSVDLTVHAAFYRVSGDYYKVGHTVLFSTNVADE
jgi:26S proteasome regulatory subunit N9